MSRKSKNLKTNFGVRYETADLVVAIKEYAHDREGWEKFTFTDSEIATALGNSKSLSGGVWAVENRLLKPAADCADANPAPATDPAPTKAKSPRAAKKK